LTEFEKFKLLETNHFGFELIKNLPTEIEKFFELKSFDLDVIENILDSPRHTVSSLSSSNESP